MYFTKTVHFKDGKDRHHMKSFKKPKRYGFIHNMLNVYRNNEK